MIVRGLLIWLAGMGLIYAVLYVRGMRVKERRHIIRRTTTFVVAALIAFIFAIIVSITNNIQGL